MEIKELKEDEIVALIHSLENDEDVNLAIKASNGQQKIAVMEKLRKTLEKKKE